MLILSTTNINGITFRQLDCGNRKNLQSGAACFCTRWPSGGSHRQTCKRL